MSKKREKANSQKKEEKTSQASLYHLQQQAKETQKLTDQNLKKISNQAAAALGNELGSPMQGSKQPLSRQGTQMLGSNLLTRQNTGMIRDDFSQKSAMKQKLFTKVNQAAVNFAPNPSQNDGPVNLEKKNSVVQSSKIGHALSAALPYPAIIETIASGVGGKDFSKLNLGSHYTGF